MPRRPASPPFDPLTSEGVRELAALLAVQSLDLRAEYEAKLRILTQIQRDIESLRSTTSSTERQRAFGQLDKRFKELSAANRDAGQTLTMIRAQFDRVARGRSSAVVTR